MQAALGEGKKKHLRTWLRKLRSWARSAPVLKSNEWSIPSGDEDIPGQYYVRRYFGPHGSRDEDILTTNTLKLNPQHFTQEGVLLGDSNCETSQSV